MLLMFRARKQIGTQALKMIELDLAITPSKLDAKCQRQRQAASGTIGFVELMLTKCLLH